MEAPARNLERRTILKAAGASVAALGVGATTGCGGESGSGNGTVTIRYSWWGAEARAKKIDQTIALFEKKYPKIKVKTDFQTYQSFWEKFQTQASGGNPPDVFQNAVTFLRKYDKRGVLLDLRPQIQAGNLKLDDFRAGVTEVGEVDGKQLGIPVGSDTMALVIDKNVWQKAGVEPHSGWTWDDFFKALKTIHDKTKVPGDTGCFSIMYLYDLYLRQNGKAFFTKDGLGFDRADLTEWWQDGYSHVKAGIVTDPKVVAQDYPSPRSPPATGPRSSPGTTSPSATRRSALGAVVGVLISSSVTAYAFARIRFAGRNLLFSLMIGTLLLPYHVLLIPQYVMFQKLELTNTYVPLLLGKYLATEAFFVFLILQFMRTLPREPDEAARIDGCLRRVFADRCLDRGGLSRSRHLPGSLRRRSPASAPPRHAPGRRPAGVRLRRPGRPARRLGGRARRLGRRGAGLGGRPGRTDRAARRAADGGRGAVRADRGRRGRTARGGRLESGGALAGAARRGRAPYRARPRRILPAGRRSGPHRVLRPVHRPAGGPGARDRRGGGRRR